MRTNGLQELISNIFSDDSTKKKFLDNPESVISTYHLTKKEKEALLKTHTELGLSANSAQLVAKLGPLGFWT